MAAAARRLKGSPWPWVIAVGAVVLAWALIPWEWSTIDDPGHVQALRDRVQELGPLGGTWQRIVDMYDVDVEWGLFRPMYWSYAATFYWLPLPLAHALRLLMLLAAIVGPWVYFSRRCAGRQQRAFIALMVVAGCSTLMIGLFFVSLQELSGAALVGLGLLTKRPWLRIGAWTLAAWFKVPFAWLLLGYALVQWRRGMRRQAAVSAAVGCGTLVLAVLMARSGSYTADYSLDPYVMWDNIPKLLEPRNAYLVLMLVWWAAFSSRTLRISSDTVLFGTALGGYVLQMLPWGVTAYYGGPISYFAALTLVSIVGPGATMSRWRGLVALALPVILATLLVAWPTRQVLQSNTVVRGLVDCLEARPGSATVLTGDLVYVTSSPEAPIRLVESLRLRDPSWDGTAVLYDPLTWSTDKSTFTHFAAVGPMGVPEGRDGTVVCQAGIASVYELAP